MKSPSVQTGLRGWIMPAQSYQKSRTVREESPDSRGLRARASPRRSGGRGRPRRPLGGGAPLGEADPADGAGVRELRLVELAPVVDLGALHEEAHLGVGLGLARVAPAPGAGHLARRERELVEGLPALALGAVEERDTG